MASNVRREVITREYYPDGGAAPMKQVAAQGQNGDTRLAHVNPWEEMLLKRMGGAGTVNPRTGLKQFYTSGDFNFPTDIMPTSKTETSAYSGLPSAYQDEFLKALMPQLKSSITDLPGNIDKYTNEALGSYQQAMQNALQTNVPKAITGLANRGILSSTEGNKVLSDVISNAATDASTKGYTTAMQAALLKAGMPGTLANVADLGKSSSSTGSVQSQDPTQIYGILANLVMSMM